MAKSPEESKLSTDAASADGAANASAKRGRGRPPKDGVKKAAYVPTGRPRGRPKSDNPKTYVPTGKPRGRPKGSTKPAASATAKPSTGRGRGRPRKSEAVEETPKADATEPKRAKGRPRKSDAAAEEVDADGEDVKDVEENIESGRKRGRASRGAEA
jgi:high mobility group AT-hook protein 2